MVLALLAALSGCTNVAAERDARARENLLGKWRSVAFYSAEPAGWQGTYEFKPSDEVEIHGAWKDPTTGAALREDEVRSFEVGAGRVSIDGAPATVVARADGRLEIVRPARARTLGADMERKIVFERVPQK